MTKKDIIGYVFVLILCGIGFLFAVYKGKELDKNYQVTLGKVYDVETSSKNPDVFAKFRYEISGQIFDHNSSIPCTHSNCLQFLYSLLKEKSLPVVYQKNDPDNCLMILSLKESAKYQINLTSDQQKIITSIDSMVNK